MLQYFMLTTVPCCYHKKKLPVRFPSKVTQCHHNQQKHLQKLAPNSKQTKVNYHTREFYQLTPYIAVAPCCANVANCFFFISHTCCNHATISIKKTFSTWGPATIHKINSTHTPVKFTRVDHTKRAGRYRHALLNNFATGHSKAHE